MLLGAVKFSNFKLKAAATWDKKAPNSRIRILFVHLLTCANPAPHSPCLSAWLEVGVRGINRPVRAARDGIISLCEEDKRKLAQVQSMSKTVVAHHVWLLSM